MVIHELARPAPDMLHSTSCMAQPLNGDRDWPVSMSCSRPRMRRCWPLATARGSASLGDWWSRPPRWASLHVAPDVLTLEAG